MYVNLTQIEGVSTLSTVAVANRFPTPLVFDKPHEIAVVEASISHIVNTPAERTIIVRSIDGSISRHNIHISKRRWNSIFELVVELTKQLKDTPFETLFQISVPKVSENPEQDTIQWKLSRNVEIYFSRELRLWLGFHSNMITSGPLPGSDRSPNFLYTKPNFQRGFSRTYLTCDYIYPSEYIWNSLHKKIASFPIKEEIFNDFSTPKPIYHPLNTTKLEKIEIGFTDEYGRNLTLEHGRAYVLIHIRPIAY